MFEPSMKKSYQNDGFLVVENLFSDVDLSCVRQRTDDIVADPDSVPEGVGVGREGDTAADRSSQEAANRAVRGTSFLVRFDPVFQRFAVQPKLLEIVRGLLGPKVNVFRDQMLLKPPGGQAKPLHQDQSYFRVHPEGELVTAWVALDEATLENGCMCYVPGSHTHGIFEIDADPDRPVHHVPVTAGIELGEPVSCPVPAGSVIFHHGCCLHASDENRTDSWRRAVILHYATARARSEKEQLNEQISLEID